MAPQPLAGIRVLDLTNVLAGPFCCHQLAHFGADVIKVEVPGRGDLARQLGADGALNRQMMGVSFLAQNAGKRSVTLNLKDPRGKTLFKRLVADADVVVENFRPGVMDRLGVGYDVLKREKPDLIYCAISGFGQDGPMRDLPAYDQIIQGVSGIMSITGAPDTAPYRVGYPICDTVGGLTAAMAVCAAVAGRQSSGGMMIDVSMLEATLATMGWVVSNYLIAGVTPAPHGNENMTSAPSGLFKAADAPINIAANKQEQFEALCLEVGREDLITNPSFKSREDRKRNRTALRDVLNEALAARSAAEWTAVLNAAGVPTGPVLTVTDILDEPQIRDRGLIETFEQVPGVDTPVRVVRTGIKAQGEPLAVEASPPALGQDNDAIYGAMGIDGETLACYRQEGVI